MEIINKANLFSYFHNFLKDGKRVFRYLFSWKESCSIVSLRDIMS
mgnify:CR=1 FL=1